MATCLRVAKLLIAYGVGIIVLVVGKKGMFEDFSSSHLKFVLTLVWWSIAVQVALAFLNKVIYWIEFDTEEKSSFIDRRARERMALENILFAQASKAATYVGNQELREAEHHKKNVTTKSQAFFSRCPHTDNGNARAIWEIRA